MHFFREPENERFSVFQKTRATGTQNANKWVEPKANQQAESVCKCTGGIQMQTSGRSLNANKWVEPECKSTGGVRM